MLEQARQTLTSGRGGGGFWSQEAKKLTAPERSCVVSNRGTDSAQHGLTSLFGMGSGAFRVV